MKFKRFLFALALTGCALQTVHAQSLDNVFREFSKCDASFFKAMKDEAQAIQALAPTDSKGDAMWLKVPNRKDEKTGTVVLAGKPTIGGLPVISYLDESSELDGMGRFYYWGFKVLGTQTSVLEKLKPLVHDNERLRKDAPVYVRTELNSDGANWQPVKTSSGAPKKGTVERAFLFEEDDKDKNVTKVFCSLQGSVEAEHLKELRPDIEKEDYPIKQVVVTFEDVNPAPELLMKLQESLKQQPLFIPKFKKAVVAYKMISSTGSFDKTETLTHVQDGVLDVFSDWGYFKFKNQFVGGADLMSIKFSSVGQGARSDAGVLLAKEGSLTVAKDLIKGEVAFKSMVRSQRTPVPESKDAIYTQVCTTGETILASDIFSKLSGRAVLLGCISDEKSKTVIGYALIEDYGLVLSYEPPDSKRKIKPVYTSITIER
jgi:hypothetical protein